MQVASGGGLMGKWLTGKRVACGGQSDADGTDLIFGRKRVEGFCLTDWIRKAGFPRVFQATGQIQKRFAEGSFATQVRKKLRLEDVPAGILAYQQEMTAGKILIGPGQ